MSTSLSVSIASECRIESDPDASTSSCFIMVAQCSSVLPSTTSVDCGSKTCLCENTSPAAVVSCLKEPISFMCSAIALRASSGDCSAMPTRANRGGNGYRAARTQSRHETYLELKQSLCKPRRPLERATSASLMWVEMVPQNNDVLYAHHAARQHQTLRSKRNRSTPKTSRSCGRGRCALCVIQQCSYGGGTSWAQARTLSPLPKRSPRMKP